MLRVIRLELCRGRFKEPATGELDTDEVHRSRRTTDRSQGRLTHQTILFRLVVLKLNCPEAVLCPIRLVLIEDWIHLASPLPVPPGITPRGSLQASNQSSLSKIPFSTCVCVCDQNGAEKVGKKNERGKKGETS